MIGLLGRRQVCQPGQQRQPAGPRALVGLPLLLHIVLGLVVGEDAQVGEEGLQHGLLHRHRRSQRDRLPHPARRLRSDRDFRVRRPPEGTRDRWGGAGPARITWGSRRWRAGQRNRARASGPPARAARSRTRAAAGRAPPPARPAFPAGSVRRNPFSCEIVPLTFFQSKKF